MPLKSNLAKEVPIVRIVERADFAPEILPQVLREINDRQWGALFQVLIEAKYKAESMLRNDTVFKEPGQVAFFQGWIVYSDYIISQLEALRSKEVEFHPGPEPGPI